jgi:hypothetical protein
MLLLYFNLNLTLLNFIDVLSRKFGLCLLPNYIAIVFLRVLATGLSLGGKTKRNGCGWGVIVPPE